MSKKEGEKTSHSSKDKKSEQKTAKENTISKKILLDNIIKKIEYYSSKTTVIDLDLYYLVKEFFTAFMELDYEFSFEEMISELDKIYLETKAREQITSFIEKIKYIEYQDEPFTQQEIKKFIAEFLPIARSLSKANTVPPSTLWSKISELFSKSKSADTKNPSIEFPEYENTNSSFSQEPVSSTGNILAQTPFQSRPENIDSISNQIQTNDAPKHPESPAESQMPTDLASIEAHNQRILGNVPENEQNKAQPNDVSGQIQNNNAESEKTVKDKVKASKKENKKTKENKKAEQSKKTKEDKNALKSKNASAATQKEKDISSVKENIAWDSETNDKAKTQQASKASAQSPAETKQNTKKQQAKKEIRKTKAKTDAKAAKSKAAAKKPAKEAVAKKEASKQASKEIKTQKAKTSKKAETKASSKQKEDIKNKSPLDSLLAAAEKCSNKKNLVDLYKKINALYSKGDAALQAKYYRHVMSIYKKLSILK